MSLGFAGDVAAAYGQRIPLFNFMEEYNAIAATFAILRTSAAINSRLLDLIHRYFGQSLGEMFLSSLSFPPPPFPGLFHSAMESTLF